MKHGWPTLGAWALLAALATGVAFAGEGDEGTPAPTEKRAGAKPPDPAVSAAAFEKGEIAREEERWKDAADAYWKAIEADRGSFLAHVRYQDAERRNGAKPEDVFNDYDSFLAEEPESVPMKLHRLRLDPVPGRVAAIEAICKVAPKDADALLELGRAQLQTGEAVKAAKALAESLAVAGAGRTDVLLLLAEAEYAAGKGPEARTRLDQALGRTPDLFAAQLLLARFDLLDGQWAEAARRAELALQMRPTWVAAFLVKAEAQSRSGAAADAIKTLETARGKKLDTDRVLLALADLNEQAATEAGFTAATTLYQQVMTRSPSEPRAPYGLGWVLERQKKFEEAEKQYRAAALLMPLDATPVDSIGFCLLKQGRITDAQTQFRKAIDLDPKLPAAYANLGATYDAQANYAEAVRWYEKLLHLKGQENNQRALVNLAFDHEALGSFPKAEDYLRKARKNKPDDALIVTWLGDNLYFQEKWKEAEKTYAEAIALDAKQFYAHRGLGFTLGKEKKWADAVAALEKARELKPTDQDVLIALGDIYYIEMEDLEKALKSYEGYIQAGGTDPVVTELITEIRKELEERKK